MKKVCMLLMGVLSAWMLCGFAPMMPTGDPRQFGLMIAIVVISGLAVVALVVWLVIQSRKGKHSGRKRP